VNTPPPPVDFVGALLPANELGPNATAQVTPGTAGLNELCGGPLKSVSTGASESLSYGPSGTSAGETIIEYRDAAAAGQEIADERTAVVSSSTGCSTYLGSSIYVFHQDVSTSVPAPCANGRSLKTFVSVPDSSGIVNTTGVYFTVQCDKIDVSIMAIGPGLVFNQENTQASALMNDAIARLKT